MNRWEYKIADLTKVEKDIGEMNRLGAEGWEAVGMALSTWAAGVSSFIRSLCSSGVCRPAESPPAYDANSVLKALHRERLRPRSPLDDTDLLS